MGERYRREDIEIQRRMEQQGISAVCPAVD